MRRHRRPRLPNPLHRPRLLKLRKRRPPQPPKRPKQQHLPPLSPSRSPSISAATPKGGTDATSVTTAKAIEIFQKNNPNVKVEIVGIPWTAEGDTKLEAALAAKSDINLFRVTSPNLPR